MGNFIQGATVGSIVKTSTNRQYFYIHNIHNDIMEMSGIEVDGWLFSKHTRYVVHEVAPPSEEHIFFDMIEKYKLKFDLNKGIVRC